MAENDVNIHSGMRVYSSDNEELGTIADVYPNYQKEQVEPVQGRVQQVEVTDNDPSYGPSSPQGYRASGPAREEITGEVSSAMMPHYYDITPEPDSVRTVANTMYMRVEYGGVLGIGSHDLYIPFSAITRVVPDDSVAIADSHQTATQLYTQKPPFLQ